MLPLTATVPSASWSSPPQPILTYQLDWWHYEKKLRAALPGELKLQQELVKLLWEGKREEHRRLLKLEQLVDGPSEKLDDLLGYLEANWGGGNLWVEDLKRQDWD